MRPLLQPVSRSLFYDASGLITSRIGARPPTNCLPHDCSRPTLAVQCQLRAFTLRATRRSKPVGTIQHGSSSLRYRHFSSSTCLRQNKPPAPAAPEPAPGSTLNTIPLRPPISNAAPVDAQREPVSQVTQQDLPSHVERQRWDVSKRLHKFMDELLARAAVASHKVNAYTGTDYTGIQAIRDEIKAQERVIDGLKTAVDESKKALEVALSAQTASTKETVALLERKQSWTGVDLDRYTALIRSEHQNERAVAAAKDAVTSAERELEAARAQLERKERTQYHEEQVWSDTIRRNSTWITLGLMGFNILLLLINIIIVEPWRRRKLVRAFNKALEEQTTAVATAGAAAAGLAPVETIDVATQTVAAPHEEVEHAIDQAVEPEAGPLEQLESPITEPTKLAEPTITTSEPLASPEPAALSEQLPPRDVYSIPHQAQSSSFAGLLRKWDRKAREAIADLFSMRPVPMRKIDLTTLALEGAAAGAALTGIIIALLTWQR